ncbi:MAG: CoA transferase, partial [Actinomycetota bacterium]
LPLVAIRGSDVARRRLPALPAGPVLPAHGIRVLDLTRVIAGPVAGRVLALLGADVLRVDSPALPEIAAQHLDTGLGKRSTLLDLGDAFDRGAFDALLAGADVLITGYRPGALDRMGLSDQEVHARCPGLVTASLSAWGDVGPWRERRGFDSLVQAATGIARIEAGGTREPSALPAQALDHATGYLLAAAVLRGLSAERGTRISASLARTAQWLIAAGPAESSCDGAGELDLAQWLVRRRSPQGWLTHAAPPFVLTGGPRTWASPPVAWGSSLPIWG